MAVEDRVFKTLSPCAARARAPPRRGLKNEPVVWDLRVLSRFGQPQQVWKLVGDSLAGQPFALGMAVSGEAGRDPSGLRFEGAALLALIDHQQW